MKWWCKIKIGLAEILEYLYENRQKDCKGSFG